jgi:hypothetical protein
MLKANNKLLRDAGVRDRGGRTNKKGLIKCIIVILSVREKGRVGRKL